MNWLYRFKPGRWLLAHLLDAGFLDCHKEGGTIFWRADFWNAKHARYLRLLQRRNRLHLELVGTDKQLGAMQGFRWKPGDGLPL